MGESKKRIVPTRRMRVCGSLSSRPLGTLLNRNSGVVLQAEEDARGRVTRLKVNPTTVEMSIMHTSIMHKSDNASKISVTKLVPI